MCFYIALSNQKVIQYSSQFNVIEVEMTETSMLIVLKICTAILFYFIFFC